MRPTHLRDRPRRHPRDCIEHQPFAHPVAHLANEDLCKIIALERARLLEKCAQRVELAPARIAPFDFRDFAELMLDLTYRQRWLGIRQPKLEQHRDRLAEICCGREYILALILSARHRRSDLPNRATAHLEALFLALCECATDHEARGDLGLINAETREEFTHELRNLQTALCLPERLADHRHIIERRHESSIIRGATKNEATPETR
jgi:hypothetical protein